MGVMGAVFAVSSVAGPLLGGWITEGPGWRWAFSFNIPLGILAIIAVAVFLKLPRRPREERERIDYLGMILLAGATTCLILVCTWGGTQYDWNSPQILLLCATTLAGAIAFVVAETRASSPVIPLSLFKDRNFTLTTVSGLAVGVAMFGAIGYMPTYIQMVKGVDATQAGLLMTPMMASLLITSIVSGQIVSRTGRYKLFPLVGMVIMGIGLWLLSTLEVSDSTVRMCVFLAVFGAGIGLSMQILVLIVQNSVPNRIVGTATASSNFFRQVGATVGSAVVGSLFISRLKDLLAENMPKVPGTSAGAMDANSFTPQSVHGLPEMFRDPVVQSYNDALLPIFLAMIPLAVVAFLLLLFVEEKPLATRVDRTGTGEISTVQATATESGTTGATTSTGPSDRVADAHMSADPADHDATEREAEPVAARPATGGADASTTAVSSGEGPAQRTRRSGRRAPRHRA